MSRSHFLDAVTGRRGAASPAFGTGTSIVCRQLMDKVKVHFPQAHLDAEAMTTLAMAGHTELGLEVVMPLFSVCHEAAAMGCHVAWGGVNAMPESGPPICRDERDIHIPVDLLKRPGCAVALDAIAMLKQRLGDDAAVCGKVMGSWTQSYHYLGIENFLIGTIDDPDQTHRILDKLLPVTVAFANAQIDAGADCILLADHATRDLCSPQAYETFLLPRHRQLAQQIRAPVILHICGNTGDRIPMIARTGLDCFHWDTKIGPASEARRLAGDRLTLMGGISNHKLLTESPEQIAAQARDAVEAGIDIVGPECAVPLATPLANLQAITSIRTN